VALTPGTRLGPYEVTAPIGEGGMGAVYRATDTSLGRQVAIKVLPDAFAQDADRLARFEREAKTLAALNHPHIAAIYGFERSSGTQALVMELVEGEDLSQRIARGPIPLDEALPIAKQIADALGAAHELGIVHRDLKPANIKVRADGTVKVLDFGLAKFGGPPEGGHDVPDPGLSPTITSPAMMTRAGMILGTAAYMSPEQARGRTVDRGTDVWAWGSVLYEMLTGRRAFDGADVADTIASVLRSEPDWTMLPATTPDAVARVLRRCLQKDRRARWSDIRDARLALEDAVVDAPRANAPAAMPNRRERIAWAAALLVCLAGGVVAFWLASRSAPASEASEMRVEVTTPPTTDPASLAISPDGTELAFVASSDGRPMLWLRSLVTGEARPLAGTDGAQSPFWSPDSRSIGFFAGSRLWRFNVAGASLRHLAPAPVPVGGTWSRDGTILFNRTPDSAIARVSEDGGNVSSIAASTPSQEGDLAPRFLPDGRRFLYFRAESNVHGVWVGTLDGPERRQLLDADAVAVFVPPARLAFVRKGVLFVQRFDPDRVVLEGEAARVAEGVAITSYGNAAVSASSAGVIAYRTGAGSRLRQLVWRHRSGAEIGEAFPPDEGNSGNVSLAPDGQQAAVSRSMSGNGDIWLIDLARRGAQTRVTSAPGPDVFPVWSPDGTRIVYAGRGKDDFDLRQVLTTGVGSDTLLYSAAGVEVPLDWSANGRFILFRNQVNIERSAAPTVGLMALPTDGRGAPIAVTGAGAGNSGAFSPDGTWVAFESNETGRVEIYIQPFPGPGLKRVVSIGGGLQPAWRPDGRELYYVAADGRLTAVPLRAGPGATLEPGSSVPLFPSRVHNTQTGGMTRSYAVARDGRFLLNQSVEQDSAPITLILNPGAPPPARDR
jgi:serine/threonine protein kinase/Tol biopolymer transport system component